MTRLDGLVHLVSAMACITEFRTREKCERAVHWMAGHGFLPSWHRPHLGHFGAEMLQVAILLAVFLTQLLYVLSNNDFRTGWVLLSAAAKALIRRGSSGASSEAAL